MKGWHDVFKVVWRGRVFAGAEGVSTLLNTTVGDLEPWEIEVRQFLRTWMAPSPWVEVRTSGSTGAPKRIHLSKSIMRNSAKRTAQYLDLNAGTSALLCLPVRHIGGMMMIVRAVVNGWTLHLTRPRANPSLDQSYDFAAMTPMQLTAYLNAMDDVPPVDTLILGGGPIPGPLERRLTGIPKRILHAYGMTETASHVAMRRVGDKVFHALPGIRFSKDERSCLVIHDPELEQQKLVTYDVIDGVTSHTFIWKGRADHAINSGGIKLHPEQIEAKLDAAIGRPFFVAGLPDDYLGEKCVLFVESVPEDGEEETLMEEVRSMLTGYEMVKACYFIPQFVRTPTGKINRLKTLQQFHL